MARYLLLVYKQEARWAELDQESVDQIMTDHDAFKAANGRYLRGGNPLRPTSAATTVRRGAGGGS